MKIHAFEPELLLSCAFKNHTFDISRETTEESWSVIVKNKAGEYAVDGVSDKENSLEFVFREACRGAVIEQPQRWPKKFDKKICDNPVDRVDFCLGCGGYQVHDYDAEICQTCTAKEVDKQ